MQISTDLKKPEKQHAQQNPADNNRTAHTQDDPQRDAKVDSETTWDPPSNLIIKLKNSESDCE